MASASCFDPAPALTGIRNKKAEDALSYLEKYAVPCGQDPDWLYLNSRSLWLLNRFDAALQRVQQAIRAEPGEPEFHLFAATVTAKMGDVAQSRSHIRELTRLKSAFSGQEFEEESEILLAVTLAQQGKSRQAIQVLEPLAQREAPNIRALYYVGLFEQSSARYEQAGRAFSRVLQLDPLNEDARRQLAIIQIDIGDSHGALKVLEQLVAQKPSAETLFQLSRAYLRLGRLKDAREKIVQSIELATDEPRYHRQLGAVLMRSGNLAEARAEMELAEELERRAGF
ncbi:MAG: tetratricopeptide repeat protein [Acidobacteriota bacterium]